MSTSGISSSLLSQIAGSSPSADGFVTDLNQLSQDVQSGKLSAAQQDYVTLSNDALTGATSSTATTSASGITTGLLSDIASSSSSSSAFVTDLNQLGTDLQNGSLSSAQGDLLSLDSTALNAASSATGGSSKTASPTSSASASEITNLIRATVQALGAGDTSAASSSLNELASIAPSSEGASVLAQQSANYGSSSDSLTSGGSVSQLLQGLNSSNWTSALDALA
jgi:hypothetical protein